MRYRIPVLTFLISISFLIPSRSASQTPAEPEKPLYRPTGREAKVIGSIMFNGEVPMRRKLDMTADPVCIELDAGAETEDLLTNQGALLNVFVYVKTNDQLQAHRFEVPETEVFLQRRNCRFSPHVVAVRVGQQLSIFNNDPTHHNAHPTPKFNLEWNQTQPPSAPPLVKKFSRSEQLIPIKCNQHPWERAYIAVMDHPFFAISNELGNYEIGGLPPGTYTLVAWHERLGEQQVELMVGSGETRRADFTFAMKKN
jgi:hypothetical protein